MSSPRDPKTLPPGTPFPRYVYLPKNLVRIVHYRFPPYGGACHVSTEPLPKKYSTNNRLLNDFGGSNDEISESNFAIQKNLITGFDKKLRLQLCFCKLLLTF